MRSLILGGIDHPAAKGEAVNERPDKTATTRRRFSPAVLFFLIFAYLLPPAVVMLDSVCGTHLVMPHLSSRALDVWNTVYPFMQIRVEVITPHDAQPWQ